MYRLRIVPLTHWIIILALVIGSLLSFSPKVEGSQTQPPAQQTAPDAACGAWVNKTVHVWHEIFGQGRAGFGAGYRYNGCRAEGLWIRPEGHTLLSSIRYDWVGFYRYPGASGIEAGVDYTVCATPIFGIAPCWGEYMRLKISKTGARSYFGNGFVPVFVK